MAYNVFPVPSRVPGVPDSGSINSADRWMAMAELFVRDGVYPAFDDDEDEGLFISAAPDALAVDLDTGRAMVRGVLFQNTALTRLPAIPAAHPTLPRRDVLSLRLTVTGNTVTILPTILTGTPAATPQLPTLTRTATIHDLAIGSWTVAAGAGLVTNVRMDPGRWIKGQNGQQAGTALPTTDLFNRYQPGETFLLLSSTLGGRALRYVYAGGFAPGANPADPASYWCIEPGQLLESVVFRDAILRSWPPDAYGIGDRPVGVPPDAAGWVSSRITWNRPRCLPGHGFRYHARGSVFTGTGADAPSQGDLLSFGLYAENPLYHRVGWFDHQPLRPLGPAYNPSVHVDHWVPGTDNALGIPLAGARTILVAQLATGKAQFEEGQFNIYSA